MPQVVNAILDGIYDTKRHNTRVYSLADSLKYTRVHG